MVEIRGTTIICVRDKNGITAIAGDGQVTRGDTVMKHTAKKVKTMYSGKILAGFAGSTADAFTLFEKFEAKLDIYGGNLTRAAVELAKEWRSDKYLRKLEALLIVADKTKTFTITGIGDVIEPDNNICSIGSGGSYAYSAAIALLENTDLSAEDIARKSLEIAGNLCIYTNNNVTMEVLKNE